MKHEAKQSQAFLKKRKMALVLPLLAVPFLTLGFWAMGGGKTNLYKDGKLKDQTGLNLQLPDPKLKKETIFDKLGFYDQADKDSMKLKEQMRNDPYYQEQQFNEQQEPSNELETIVQNSAGKFNQTSLTEENKIKTSPYNTNTNQAEENLMKKLAELNKAISQPPPPLIKPDEYAGIDENLQSDSNSDGSVSRLENMLQSMNQDKDGDPELDQLSGMMDKIIDIQHPEKVKEELKQKFAGQKANVFAVTNTSVADTSADGFYSLDALDEVVKSNAIEAVVNEDQVLVSGAVIKLRLASDAFIKEVKIPAGHFVFGIVKLDGERLTIEINSIRYGNAVYPVKMEVYDMDGMEGIYIPGAINRDVIKQSADNSMQTMGMTSIDPSLSAQVSSAGVNTLKSLLSKKVKLVKVMVKAGYKVLLKDASL